MPRTPASAPITSRTARAKLKPRREPYWTPAGEGVSLGYRTSEKAAGRWIVRTRRHDGKYVYASLASADDLYPADGESVLTFQQAQVRAREALTPKTTVTRTVADAGRAWAADKMAHATGAQARRNHKAAGERLARAFPDQPIATLTRSRIEAWRDAFVGAADDGDPEAMRRRRASFNRELANLKAALTRAAGRGPWDDVKKFGRVDSFGARVGILTSAEIERLLIAAPNRETRDLLDLLAETGCRYGEIAAARIRDFDAGARTLRVSGKTGARRVTLSDRALALLTTLCAGANDPERAILRRPDGKPWLSGDQTEPTRRAFECAGLTHVESVSYTLRHSAISRWLAAGAPLAAVAEQAGTSALMIEQTYAQWLPDDRRRWFR